MKLYLLNALITPFKAEGKDDVGVFAVNKIQLADYCSIIRQAASQKMEIISAIGHQSTAEFLKTIIDDDLKGHIVYNRESIFFEPGDLGLVFRITDRGEMLRELDVEQLKSLHAKGAVEFLIFSRIYAPETIMNPLQFFKQGE